MRAAALTAIALLAGACAFPVPKSRIEPHERVAIDMSGVDELRLDLPGIALDAAGLDARFAASVERELAQRRSLAQNHSRADAVLALRLARVALEERPDEQAALRIIAAARVETGGADPGKPRGPWHASEYESSARALSTWSDAHAKLFHEELEIGFERVAEELVAGAIRARETK